MMPFTFSITDPVLDDLQHSLKTFALALMGLKNTGVIVANKDTLLMIGDLSSHGVLLGILGFFIITVLSSRHFHAAVLARRLAVEFFLLVPDISGVIGEVDLSGALTLELAGV